MVTQIERPRLGNIASRFREQILGDWLNYQTSSAGPRAGLIRENELRSESSRFLELFIRAVNTGNVSDIGGQEWEEVRAALTDLSRSRAQLGFTPSETATFVLSLKRPLFAALRRDLADEPDTLADELWALTVLLDSLALFTTEVFQRSREEIIQRQQQELLELSTPVSELWDGILAVPLIGTLDSARTQVVMESLLQQIVDSRASIAIIDITGVPTVDTLVAQHLLKTVAAARLMGAECIISGIRPQIAQTIVHLGVALGDVSTKSSLADALKLALGRRGLSVVSRQA